MKLKFFAGFLALILLFTLAACGKTETPQTGSQDVSGVTGTSSGSQTGSTDLSDGTDSDTDVSLDGSVSVTDTDSAQTSSDLLTDGDSEDSSEDDSYDPPPTGGDGSDDAPPSDGRGDGALGDNLPESYPSAGGNGNTGSSSPSVSVQPPKNADEYLLQGQYLVGLCDQINGRIIICDLAVKDWSNDSAVVWEYQHDTQGRENYGWNAGLKFRHSSYYGEDVLIFCGPPSRAYVVSMKTKKILLTAENAGVNPHSVELLPNGTLIVASSNDGLISVYAPGNTRPSFTMTVKGLANGTTDAHGVLWDPDREVVWIAGGEKLRAFRYTGTTYSPKLEFTSGMEYTTPKSSIHDLAPVYGNKDQLLITCASGAMVFDKNKGTFSYDYSGSDMAKNFGYIPGCGNYADGVFACTAIKSDTKVYQDWDTNIVQVYVPFGDGVILTRKAPNDAYYKLRVYNFDYQ